MIGVKSLRILGKVVVLLQPILQHLEILGDLNREIDVLARGFLRIQENQQLALAAAVFRQLTRQNTQVYALEVVIPICRGRKVFIVEIYYHAFSLVALNHLRQKHQF